MDQAAFDFTVSHARRSDPTTSSRAAASMIASSEAQREAVYWALLRAGVPLTAHEIAARTGLDQVQVCRRLPDLEKQGRAEPTDIERPGPSGRPSRCWRLRAVGAA